MNLTLYVKRAYENFLPLRTMKNEPNFREAKITVSRSKLSYQTDYSVGLACWLTRVVFEGISMAGP